jgi:hypothetical protein
MRAGAQGLAGPQGAAGFFSLFPLAGAQGLPAAGPQGLAAAGPQGLPLRMSGFPAAGPQGLLGPHGLRIVCATRSGLSAAATGVEAAAVAAIAAAMVDRLPANNADFSRPVRILCSFSTGSQAHDVDLLDHCFAAIFCVQPLGGQWAAAPAFQPGTESKAEHRDDD